MGKNFYAHTIFHEVTFRDISKVPNIFGNAIRIITVVTKSEIDMINKISKNERFKYFTRTLNRTGKVDAYDFDGLRWD